jgi:hypothetical protein
MMLNNNGKNQKQNSAKKNVKSSGVSDRETFEEEFSEEFSVKKSSNDAASGLYPESSKKAEKIGNSFKEEFSEGLVNDVSHFGIQSYSKAGVTFEKLSENQARINYSGLLATSGAQDITGVFGFGSNQKWEDVASMTFKKDPDGAFVAVLPVEQGKNINVAFKDSAENWDNNSGMNYTFVN